MISKEFDLVFGLNYKRTLYSIPKIFLVSLVGGTITYGLVYAGFDRVDASSATLLIQTEVPFGVIKTSVDGVFSGIDEKPIIRNFVAAGIYYLSPEVRSIVSEGKVLDMPSLLNQAQELGLKIGVFPIHEYWTDVGCPGDLEAANAKHIFNKNNS